MAFFDDMNKAVEDYPLTDVDLEIVDVVTPGSAINTGEISTFRVKVTNRGPLTLTGVTLRISGQNGATVANNGFAPFVADFVTQALLLIDAHGGSQLTVGGPLKFKAPNTPQASKNLVKATLEDWNPTLDHMLNAHSRALDTPKGNFAAPVIVA
jgi:hypothetical protein